MPGKIVRHQGASGERGRQLKAASVILNANSFSAPKRRVDFGLRCFSYLGGSVPLDRFEEDQMDDIRRTKVRMLRRFLEKIEQEIRIVLSEEESKFKTDRAKRELEEAESSVRDALKHMQRAVADAGEDPEQPNEPPWA
jgi:hypothetical protein